MSTGVLHGNNSNPSVGLAMTGPKNNSLENEVVTCHSCGAIFTKSSARFCSKCGTKKGGSSSKSRAQPSSALGALPGPSVQGFLKDAVRTNSNHYECSPNATTDASLKPEDGVTTQKSNQHTVSWEASATNKGENSSKNNKTVYKDGPKKKNSRKKAPRGSSGPCLSVIDASAGGDSVPAGLEVAMTPLSNDGESAHARCVEFSTTEDSIEYNISSTIAVSSTEEAQYNVWATLSPESLTPEMLQTPNAEMLKTWRKGNLVGRGTYGSVYLGLLPSGHFYAVKIVDISQKGCLDVLNFNAKMLVSLSREINIMRRLRHPNLCGFTGVYYDLDSSSICIFMEYIGGGSLSNVVRRFKPLPMSVVRSWTKQLLSGLLYLHSQNIMHRDIKADNVLVDTSVDPDSESQIKLVDFGAARRLVDALSQSHTLIGTPYWMAPEVVSLSNFETGYSYKADVWSVGCTVAEMLTGKPPWPCQSNAPATIIMIASSQGLPTELPKDEASPGCYDFMLQCFERDPDKRPTVEKLLHHPWIRGEME
ncbi:unnamed protein product [Phytomonas sp. EM1]|nr:unnamed protein product [Phytomonas sp. EM1]|eukprot:CCW62584.1 unnamed protein product [Phytomonas sp. isolate EM1]